MLITLEKIIGDYQLYTNENVNTYLIFNCRQLNIITLTVSELFLLNITLFIWNNEIQKIL